MSMTIYEKDGFRGELIENALGQEVLTLLEYKGRRKKVSVPAGIEGIKVEFLCRTFLGNEVVEEVRVPRGVTTLGDEVFEGCTNLKKVSLSKTVREIGREVFHHCTHLEEVEIPTPSQVDIHHLAFDEGRYPWNKEGFLIVGQVLFQYSGQDEVVRIPEGVREVRQTAFYYGAVLTSMKELYFPSTLTEIASDMFTNCIQLKKLVLAEGLKTIADRAFLRLGLEEVQLPSTLETLGEHSFSACHGLGRITFAEPSSLKVIGANTFGCGTLEEIHLPDSVERVETGAFVGCDCLIRVTLPPKAQVEKGAFQYPREEAWEFIHPQVVASYEDIDQSTYYRKKFDRWAKLKPDKQEEIKEGIGRYVRELDCCVDYLSAEREQGQFLNYLFQNQTEKEMDLFFHWGLTLTLAQFERYLDHAIQRGHTTITAYLLQKKRELYTQTEIDAYETRKEQVELGLQLPTLEELSRRWYLSRQKEGVVVSGYRGGSGREVLPSYSADGVKMVRVGSSVPRVRRNHPFEGLTLLEMGEGTLLREETFERSSLEEIRLPKDMEVIAFRTFANCPLKEVEIPEGVERIDEYGFSHTELEEIVLPSSLKLLEYSAFHGCRGLKKVVFRGSIEVLDPITLKSSDSPFARLGEEVYFQNCSSLEFVGEEGGENQLDHLRGQGIIEKP